MKTSLPSRDPLLSFSLFAISFSIGFFLYLAIEKLFKHFSGSPTHWSMGLVAGLACVFLLFLDKYPLPLALKALGGGLFITSAELLVGMLLNLRLHMGIWDYTHLPLNYRGQISLAFSLLWVLSSFGIILFNRILTRFFFHLLKND